VPPISECCVTRAGFNEVASRSESTCMWPSATGLKYVLPARLVARSGLPTPDMIDIILYGRAGSHPDRHRRRGYAALGGPFLHVAVVECKVEVPPHGMADHPQWEPYRLWSERNRNLSCTMAAHTPLPCCAPIILTMPARVSQSAGSPRRSHSSPCLRVGTAHRAQPELGPGLADQAHRQFLADEAYQQPDKVGKDCYEFGLYRERIVGDCELARPL